MSNQVHILFAGYSYIDPRDGKFMRANCSCTLIRCGVSGRNIIVDTMTAWDGDRIVEALKKYNLTPADIYAVICTHGHSDHIGGNYLFQEATWHFIGTSASQRDKYLLEWEETFELDGSNVILERTPGHTLSCVSVIVRDTSLGKVVGICGDLFERQEDIEKPEIWIDAGSENCKSQREQRLRMANMCDYIIPGHGEGFPVTSDMRSILLQQTEGHKTAAI